MRTTARWRSSLWMAYLNREPVWVFSLRLRLTNIGRRLWLRGQSLEFCDACGRIVASRECRTFGMTDGSDERNCRDCTSFRRLCRLMSEEHAA